MVENVFILGAGASKESGAPLMNEFLNRAEDLLRDDAFGNDTESIKKVFKVISELQNAQATSDLDLDNIEILFGALEMAKIINQLGESSQEDIKEYGNALIKLIVKTLEHSMNYRFTQSGLNSSESYQDFSKLLMNKKYGKSSV